ncbi:MAG: hypothetical protein MRY21_06040 [Simkaniaceae bacterium]|nr:hypothetical protein [Simkaniaceae bacterium]
MDSLMDKMKKLMTMPNVIVTLGVLFVFSFTIAIATDLRPHHLHLKYTEYQQNLSWVKDLLTSYKELSWFSDKEMLVTEENQASNSSDAWSQRLFGERSIEFDRTIMSMLSMRTILDGKYEDYLEFVAHQKEDARLNWQSFQNLQTEIRAIVRSYPGLNENEVRKAIEASIIINDLGKLDRIRQVARPYGEFPHDHNEFACKAMQLCPHIFPLWQSLSAEQQKLIVSMSGLAPYGRITHLEGSAGMFKQLKNSPILTDKPIAFEIGFFVHICDVAGALGHVDQRSSLVYDENTHKALSCVKMACLSLKEGDESAAYASYLTQRASWLGLDGDSPLHQVLARIGAMLRLFTPDEGKMLKEAFLKLAPEALADIVEEFNGIREPLDALAPTDISTLLANLYNNYHLGDHHKERLTQTIHIGLPFISQVIKEHRKGVSKRKIDASMPLNFHEIARIAKESPRELIDHKFTISKTGEVHLKGK